MSCSKMLVPSRGLFASGKFDQYKRDIPYSTWPSLSELVRPLLGKSDRRAGELARTPCMKALGPTGAHGRRRPELKSSSVNSHRSRSSAAAGTKPFSARVPALHRHLRRRNIRWRSFSTILQWLDAATLDLLEDLLTRSDLQHLMLIGAFGTTRLMPLIRYA